MTALYYRSYKALSRSTPTRRSGRKKIKIMPDDLRASAFGKARDCGWDINKCAKTLVEFTKGEKTMPKILKVIHFCWFEEPNIPISLKTVRIVEKYLSNMR